MPAVVAGQPFFLARAGGRCLFSSSLPLPRFLLSANVPGKLPLCSFSPLFSRGGHGTATAISAAGKKYIEEDYIVKKVTAKEVEELVKGERSIPIVLDFYATWCGPCILMAQALEMVVPGSQGLAEFGSGIPYLQLHRQACAHCQLQKLRQGTFFQLFAII